MNKTGFFLLIFYIISSSNSFLCMWNLGISAIIEFTPKALDIFHAGLVLFRYKIYVGFLCILLIIFFFLSAVFIMSLSVILMSWTISFVYSFCYLLKHGTIVLTAITVSTFLRPRIILHFYRKNIVFD